MYEKKFWRPVLSVFSALFLADLGQIPHVESSIGSGRSEDGFVMWRPLHLEDFVLVALERMQFQFEVPEIPEGYSFVGGSCSKNVFRVWIERETIHFRGVSVDRVTWPGRGGKTLRSGAILLKFSLHL